MGLAKCQLLLVSGLAGQASAHLQGQVRGRQGSALRPVCRGAASQQDADQVSEAEAPCPRLS